VGREGGGRRAVEYLERKGGLAITPPEFLFQKGGKILTTQLKKPGKQKAARLRRRWGETSHWKGKKKGSSRQGRHRFKLEKDLQLKWMKRKKKALWGGGKNLEKPRREKLLTREGRLLQVQAYT